MPSYTASANKRLSFVTTNALSSPTRLSLLLGVLLLATYPQVVSAAPGGEQSPRQVRRSQKIDGYSFNSDSQSKDVQPLIMRRKSSRDSNDRRGSPFDIFAPWFGFGSSNPNAAAQFEDNSDNNRHTTSTKHQNNPTSTSTKNTTTTTPRVTSTPPPQSPANTPTSSPSTAPSMTGGMNSDQESNASDSHSNTGDGNGETNTAATGTHSFTTGQPYPPPNNAPYNNPSHSMTFSAGVGGDPTASNQAGVRKGLVIGLVISLILLVAFCALAAFLVVRRIRKRRRQEASPYNDTTPWIGGSKRGLIDDGYNTEKTETREGSEESHASRPQSTTSEPRLRARTPGGSSAVPVPYDPSEVSDDVSAHFKFFPQDESVGVPVPYPLALHIPARVAQAMAEREARWQQNEDPRLAYGRGRSFSTVSGQTQDEILTIPDRGSRRSTRRSTSESMTSSNDGAYYTLAPNRLSTPYSEALSRSDVGMNGYPIDNRASQASEGDYVTVSAAEFPLPPPPPPARTSTRLLRRTSAAPSVGASYSPRLGSVSENPFATKTEVNPFEDAAAVEVARSLDEGTTTHHGLTASTAVGGVVERVVMRSGPARQTVLRHSALQNPFEDTALPVEDRRASNSTVRTEQRSIRDSDVYAGVVEHQTVDGHDAATFAFPAPPNPT